MFAAHLLVIALYWGLHSCLPYQRLEASIAGRLAMAVPIMTISVSSCLGRTCLQWGADGDLTALDLELVMERLAQVDQEVAALRHGSLSL